MIIFGNVIGILGMILIILAYYLLQTNKLKATDIMFTHINTLGSFCLLISLLITFNIASFVLEVTWLGIGLYTYYNYYIKKKKGND